MSYHEDKTMTMNKGKALGEVYPFDLSYMSLDQAELCWHLVVKRDSMQNATSIPESRKTAKMHEAPLIFSSTLMILVVTVSVIFDILELLFKNIACDGVV